MQGMSLLQLHMIAFAAGFVLDLMVGDPHGIPHPIVWIGKLIARLDKKLLGEIPEDRMDPETRDKAAEHRKGLLLVIIATLPLLRNRQLPARVRQAPEARGRTKRAS